MSESVASDLAARLQDELGLTLQWCAPDAPADVETAYDPAADEGDDPAAGHVATQDDQWTAVLVELDGDAGFHHRRATLAGIGLHVVVRDVEETTLMAWPSDDAVEDVVLTLPVEVVLAAPGRRDAYVEAVVTLVTAVGDALGADA